MLEIDRLLLAEIIRLKNINKSLGQKVKYYDEMLSLKVRLTMEQQKYLSCGVVVNKEMFNSCSKDLLEHLEYLRNYEYRSDVLDIPRIIKLNGKKITTLRDAIKVIKESRSGKLCIRGDDYL